MNQCTSYLFADPYGGNKNLLIGCLEYLGHKGCPFLRLISLEESTGVYKVSHQLSFCSFFDNPLGKRNSDTRQALLHVL